MMDPLDVQVLELAELEVQMMRCEEEGAACCCCTTTTCSTSCDSDCPSIADAG